MWPRGWVEVQLYSSMTAALEGGEWSAARTDRTLPPGKTRYPFYRRLGGPEGRSGWVENLVPTGIRSRTVQPIVSRYSDSATRPTHITIKLRHNSHMESERHLADSILLRSSTYHLTSWSFVQDTWQHAHGVGEHTRYILHEVTFQTNWKWILILLSYSHKIQQ